MSRIEVREFIVPVNHGSGVATNQFLVKYNNDGTREELHGVAINRESREYNPTLTGKGSVLKVASVITNPKTSNVEMHDKDYPSLNIKGFKSLYFDNQRSRKLFEGNENEVSERWAAVKKAALTINSTDAWHCESSGGAPGEYYTGNSNSVAATLQNIMGFKANKIDHYKSAPGLEKSILHIDSGLYNPKWSMGSPYESTPIDNIDSFASFLRDIMSGNTMNMYEHISNKNTMHSKTEYEHANKKFENLILEPANTYNVNTVGENFFGDWDFYDWLDLVY